MGNLYIVGTPIGNLGDITFRAVETLKSVDLIACEDTRRSRILVDRYNINKPLVSYHQHSKFSKIDYLIGELKSGKNIALITDAGTPGISDPGGVLVEKVLQTTYAVKEAVHRVGGIKVVPIPGPSALTAALSISGIPADSFLFLGFLPKKKGRQTIFRKIVEGASMKLFQTIVFYESPYQILRTLDDFNIALGDYEAVVGREITKKFEEIFRGKLSKAVEHFKKNKPKGEFTVCIKIV